MFLLELEPKLLAVYLPLFLLFLPPMLFLWKPSAFWEAPSMQLSFLLPRTPGMQGLLSSFLPGNPDQKWTGTAAKGSQRGDGLDGGQGTHRKQVPHTVVERIP